MADVSRARNDGDLERPAPLRTRAAHTPEGPASAHAGLPSAKAKPRVHHLSPANLQRLSRSAGNRAVAGMVARAPTTAPPSTSTATPGTTAAGLGVAAVETGLTIQRYAGMGKGGGYAPPAPPVAPNPSKDPKFTKVTKDLKQVTKETKAHPPGKGEAKKAGDAAVPPADHKQAQAKAGQADKMAGAKKGGFDKAGFIAAVKRAIGAAAPKNLEEADEFGNSGKAEGVKTQVMDKVSTGKKEASKDVEAKTKEPPDPAAAVEKPVTPLGNPELKKPEDPAFAKAMPDKVPAEQTKFDGAKNETDDKMKEANVSESDLEKSNEPKMQQAVKDKKEGEQVAKEAPDAVRKKEAAVLKEAEAAAGSKGKSAVTAMFGGKKDALAKAGGAKTDQKSKDEAKRTQVTTELNKIFDTTKLDVEKILTDLDTKVSTAFTDGEKVVRSAFTSQHKREMEQFKDRRYSGASGVVNWGYDLFNDLSEMPEVKDIYVRAVTKYEQGMEGVINNVADVVGKEMDAAKDRITKGRTEITKWISSQPKDVQKLATDAAKQMDDRFKQLEDDVDAKGNSLAQDLAEKYKAALADVNKEVEEAQAENRSAWSKAKAAIGDALEAILKLKELFAGLLSKAMGAFKKILADPIAFIGNFMSAVKSGFMNFAAKIGEHLKKGLQGWLFGKLAEAGIEIPDKFDLPGIIKMVLSILGLTWQNIRAKLVKKIGEKAMKALETTSEVFVILVKEGVAGLWKWIVDKVGDLQQMVIGQIKDFVIEKIVKAGITWVIGMLNPAGALIKIIQTLISVIQWIMEKGGALVQLVSTIVDSVSDIANGGMGGVPAKIESALAQAVPIVISFLASLLGLGGISEKIKSILEAVQKPVMKAVDAVINGALKLGKKIIDGIKGIGKKAKQGLANAGKKAKDFVKKIFGPVQKPVSMAGTGHTIHVTAEGRVEMASERGLLSSKVAQAVAKLNKSDPAAAPGQIDALQGIGGLAKALEAIALVAKKEGKTADLLTLPEFVTAYNALHAAIGAYATKFKQADLIPAAGSNEELRRLINEFGMPMNNYMHLQGVANRHGVAMDVRSTNSSAVSLLKGGAHPKPEFIKSKTVDDIDFALYPGIKAHKGKVGLFEPVRPTTLPEGFTWAQIDARIADRQTEWKDDYPKLKKIQDKGWLVIGGGIVTAPSGRPFTGDHDLFRVLTPDGQPLETKFAAEGEYAPLYAGELKKKVAAECAGGGVRHEAHMDWEEALLKMAPESDVFKRNKGIFDKIIATHQGGEALIRIAAGRGPTSVAG